jgi:Protein of unknown function (DUF2950)
MTLHNLSKDSIMHAIFSKHVLLIALIAATALPAQAADTAPKSAATKEKAAALRQQAYASPQDAVKELMAAAKANDLKAMLAVLGAGAKPIISSGDAVADKRDRERFVKSYEEAGKIEQASDTKAVLVTGKDGWPFPIPLVKDAQGWRFDAKAGQEEIINRRVGRNELAVIQVLQAVVDAQREYYLRNPQGDKLLQYAQRLASTKGKRDGLYFPTKAGDKPSPIGPQVDAARAEGYSKSDKGSGYHGYHYRILKGQGPEAKGGAYDYVAQGRMIGGFALLAWPVKYGNSGVMTFMVNHDGVVFEKDLGPDTAAAVQRITKFNPDKSWKRS